MHRKTSKALALGVAATVAIGTGFAQSQIQQSQTQLQSTQSDSGTQSRTRPRAPRIRPPAIPNLPRAGIAFGDPLQGLTADELADFTEGLEEFQSQDTAESGLGPIFNNVSCVICHASPAVGGVSANFVTRFGHSANRGFDPMTAAGGSLLQDKAIDPAALESIPRDANVTTRRITTPLFGAGLIEAIPDSTIMDNANARKPDGVSGKVSMVQDAATGQMRVGRFGWKAQQASLLTFAGDAYLNEMGITNRVFPTENAPNGNMTLLAKYDLVDDPEDQTDPASGKADIDHFADFMRLLAPPSLLALSDDAKAGAALFVTTGCQACHQAAMVTGANPVAALDRKVVMLFSDQLLHDMGSLGDGIVQGSAGAREMRTSPLWGLRGRNAFLHDGRAVTVDAAIRMHDGEAAPARDRYVNRLSPALQRQLQAFLDSI